MQGQAHPGTCPTTHDRGRTMFIVFLRFTEKKSQASDFMEGHKAWIQKGFDDNVFLLVGSLQPNAGGTVFAHETSLSDLEKRVASDPFVAEGIVTSEILEVTPARATDPLQFLMP